MSRKSKSFSQLYDYLTRDTSSFTFSRNTYTKPKDKKEFINEFYTNARHLRKARGKVFMYHEVLSLEKNNLSPQQQKEILLDLSDKYLYQRAQDHLAFGVVHEEKENVHVHLMISSNEIEGDKRIRLSKQEFSAIQSRIENYKNQKYNELSKSFLYSNKKDLSKSKQNEQELKNRGNTSIRDTIKEELEKTFKNATSLKYLENHLHSLGYAFYTRGKVIGVNYKGKPYRLKTLGLDTQYKQLIKKCERGNEREDKRNEAKQSKSKKHHNPRFYRDVGRKKAYDEAEQEDEIQR